MAIGSVHRYRFDPFFRTEVNVVALQIAFALFILGLVGFVAVQLYNDASNAVAQGINESLLSHSNPLSIGTSVIAELDYTRSRTLLFAGAIIIMVTIVFSYVIARLALAPTRNALESQKRFIGNIAHELRTPLSIIKTNTEVRLLEPDISASARELHKGNLEELDRISETINNLLSLSASIRPERLEFQDVDLGRVVHAVTQKLRNLTESKHLEMEARLSERRAVWGNVVALEQIVMNIVRNAILYTPQGGHILVTVEPVYPDFIELTVQDSGAGIARKDLFRIFEPFYRGDPSRKRGEGGSGLGLTIVSELVKLHNGKITVRSAEGRGTVVTVLLPAGRIEVASKRPGKQSQDINQIEIDFSQNQPSMK